MKDLNYEDILLRNNKSVVSSRSECNIETFFGKKKYASPVCCSNMKSLLTQDICKIFDDRNYLHFINYRNSSYQSVLNDFILTYYCDFAICNIGGYAVLPSILGKPNLLVNTSGFFDNYFFNKTIYHPKSFQKDEKILSIL